MKIIKLKSENIKKIKVVEISPKDNTVIISGKNGQGKTSVLDSILYALAGKKNIEKLPIRDGEEKAKIEIELDKYLITRTFTDKGTYLKVEDKKGIKYGQELLDEIINGLAFDPLKFSTLSSKEQLKVILDILGDEIKIIDETIKEIYEERKFIGRDKKNLEGELKSYDENLENFELIDIEKLIQRKEELKTSVYYESNLKEKNGRLNEEVDQLRERIFVIEEEIKVNDKELSGIDNSQMEEQLDKLDKEIQLAKDNNIKANESIKLADCKKKLDESSKKYNNATAELKTLEDSKKNIIKKSKLPIDGLGINNDGILYNGVPFEQICTSEKIKIGMKISIALNPELKVIRIKDGSLLDTESMDIVKDIAKDKDYQVWIEVVDADKKDGVFFIEDGEII